MKELDSPCRDTCSGWRQGFEKGRESMRQEGIPLGAGWSDYLAVTEQLEAERERSEKLVTCLKTVLSRISCMEMTFHPINVREADGSISTQRPRSNAGLACDDINAALAEYKSGIRTPDDPNPNKT